MLGKRSWVTALLVVAMMVVGLVPSASAAVSSVSFDRDSYGTGVGDTFGEGIGVTVTGESGPVEGVEVTFSVIADPVSGASVQLSTTTATTDENGTASVAATAGDVEGLSWVVAEAEDAVGRAFVVTRPYGYAPGEQLATIEGLDQDDVLRTIGRKTKGRQYLLIDVCAGWCAPCREFAQETQTAVERLARLGVDVHVVTLLLQGSDYEVSDTQDARNWVSRTGLTGPVLHAGGDRSSLYRSGMFFLSGDLESPFAYPTHLLVDPKGKILDRRVGGADTADQTVQRVLIHVPCVTAPVVGEVGVRLPDGGTNSQSFYEYAGAGLDWGSVYLDGTESSSTVSRSWRYEYRDLRPLPSEGTLELSLTRFRSERTERLATGAVRVTAFMAYPHSGQSYSGVEAAVTLPAVQGTGRDRGTVTVPIDMATLRESLAVELEEGSTPCTKRLSRTRRRN